VDYPEKEFAVSETVHPGKQFKSLLKSLSLQVAVSEKRRPDYGTLFAVAAVLFLAMLMRLLPMSIYAIWGSDTGEYYFITDSLVEDGGLPDDYEGWGFAYPYFAGMESVSAALSLVCGFETIDSLAWIIPALSAFLVLPLFLISFRAFGDRRAALAAAALLAVASPSVFTTSHPMPGSLGDLMALVLFLGLMRITGVRPGGAGRGPQAHAAGEDGIAGESGMDVKVLLRDRRVMPHLILFLFAALALTLTHHLTAYFVIIPLGLFLIMRIIIYGNASGACERVLFLLLCMMVFLSWLYWFIAVPGFRERIVEDALPMNAVLLSVVIFGLLTVLRIVMRIRPHLREIRYVPRYPDFGNLLRIMIIYLLLAVIVLSATAVLGVPGTAIDIGPGLLVFGLPLVLLLSFAVIGPSFARFYRHGIFLYAWLGALVISLLLASAAGSTVFLPYRHIQYLMEPAAIFTGLGMARLFDHMRRDLGTGAITHTGAQRSVGFFPTVFVSSMVILVAAAGVTAYPPREMLGGFEEGTTREEMRAVLWEREHPESDSKVATDHRMSSLTFGFAHRDASWDDAYLTLHADSYEDCREEIEEEGVNYVLINDMIREGAALKQWENADPMSDEAVEKFEKPPFLKLYDDGTSRVYRIEIYAMSY